MFTRYGILTHVHLSGKSKSSDVFWPVHSTGSELSFSSARGNRAWALDMIAVHSLFWSPARVSVGRNVIYKRANKEYQQGLLWEDAVRGCLSFCRDPTKLSFPWRFPFDNDKKDVCQVMLWMIAKSMGTTE